MEQIQELITRVINGDTQAFEEIYQATYRQVYYTAFSFLENSHLHRLELYLEKLRIGPE